MAIIDKTYFSTDIALSTQWDDEIDIIIPIVEENVLRKLLGDVLYVDYVANPTDARWVALVDGENYTYNDRTIKWDGIKGVPGNSMLAYFVFEHMLRHNFSQVVDRGVIRQVSEKGTQFDGNNKMAMAHNAAVNIYGSLMDSAYKPTAINFLRWSSYTFDDWYFTEIEKINLLGI